MRQMIIAAVLVTFPALVVLLVALAGNPTWILPVIASILFTALPFILAIIWLRNQHRRQSREDRRSA